PGGRRRWNGSTITTLKGLDAPKIYLWGTASAAREKQSLDSVAASVTMECHRSIPYSWPGCVVRCVTGISIYEPTA
ncbi:MAG: hypothetical protein AAF862_13880, partial [Pseudomonadota bacterium]